MVFIRLVFCSINYWDHHLMANILAGNLNSSFSYLITTVNTGYSILIFLQQVVCMLWSVHKSFLGLSWDLFSQWVQMLYNVAVRFSLTQGFHKEILCLKIDKEFQKENIMNQMRFNLGFSLILHLMHNGNDIFSSLVARLCCISQRGL